MILEQSDLLIPSTMRGINANYRRDETSVVGEILNGVDLSDEVRHRSENRARRFVEVMRETSKQHAALDTLLAEYKLSTREGLALMCLAEALLRIPDRQNADRLIRDKILNADWATHFKGELYPKVGDGMI